MNGENIGVPVMNSGPRPIHFGPVDRMSRTHHGAFNYSKDPGHEHVNVSDIMVGKIKASPRRICGHLPRVDQPKHVTAIPKYLGHITKKGPNNTFATRWRPGNEISQARLGRTNRTRSERAISRKEIPEDFMRQEKFVKCIPRVPGTMTHIPGVEAECVYGLKYGVANRRAQELRQNNPYCSAKWVCRDPQETLRYRKLIPGTHLKADLMQQYNSQEEKFASLSAMESKLLPVYTSDPMSWTRYCTSSALGLSYDKVTPPPGPDRVGARSFYGTEQLEAQRWQHHMWFSRDPCCGSMKMGAMIEPH